MAAQKVSDIGPNKGNWASTLGQRPIEFTPTLGQRPSKVISIVDGWWYLFLQVGVLKFHLRITRLQFCLVYWLIIRGLSLLVSQTSFSCRSESSNKSLVVLVISSACTSDFSLSLKIFTRREKLKAVINFNSRCIWLFYNEIGAVAQCPNNRGVGSAFHRMKIHICNYFCWPSDYN